MRLILEKAEIVAILSKNFDVALDPEGVVIRTDPFEIELCGLPLGTGETPSNVVPLTASVRREHEVTGAGTQEGHLARRYSEDTSLDPPPPGDDGFGGSSGSALHPAAVLAASKELERQLDRERAQRAPVRLGGSSTMPTNTHDEIS